MPEEIPYSGKEKGILPPEQGLAFVRDEMSLTVSKKYMIILLINAKMVSDQTPIKLISENINIISLSQESISFKKEEANMYGLVIKRFLIEAKAFSNEPVRITANSGILYCHALIKPIEYEIHYPEQGLEFYPHRIKHKPDRNHMGYLYVDVKQFEPGKTIFIEAEEPFVDLEVKQITLKDTDFDSNGIVWLVDTRENDHQDNAVYLALRDEYVSSDCAYAVYCEDDEQYQHVDDCVLLDDGTYALKNDNDSEAAA
jgi:hypothetical protein